MLDVEQKEPPKELFAQCYNSTNHTKQMRTTSLLLIFSTMIGIVVFSSIADSVSNNPRVERQEQQLCIDNSFSWCK